MSENETVYAEERQLRILEVLKERKRVSVVELASIFSVTPATIRSDLREMEGKGLLMRTHGGAIERTKTSFELDAKDREVCNLDLKQRIAKATLAFIQEGDTVILDTGTTTLALAKLLLDRKKLTVLTNDIVIARTLEEAAHVDVILMGGMLRKGFHCTVGPQARDTMAGLVVDKAFMGTNSFSPDKGAMTPDIHQAETKKRMIAISNKVILLCDSSKQGRASFARFATLDQIDALVTDAVDAKEREKLEENGVEVVIAPS